MSKTYKIEDFTPDENNFNLHTQRGMGLLEKSIEKVGIIESVTVSADDKVISGNARQEVISQKFGDKDAIVIETDGTKPVVIKRTDIKSNTKQFYEAALLANTVSKHNVNLDVEKIEEVAVEEFGIEVEELGVDLGFDSNEDQTEEKTFMPTFKFKVECNTESEKNKIMAELMQRGYTCTDDY